MIFKALCLLSLLYAQTYASQQTCVVDDDCQQTLMVHYRCISNLCKQTCALDQNCPQDYNCVNGSCFMVQSTSNPQPVLVSQPIINYSQTNQNTNQQQANALTSDLTSNQQQQTGQTEQNIIQSQVPEQTKQTLNSQSAIQQPKPKKLSGHKIKHSNRVPHRHEKNPANNQQRPNQEQQKQSNNKVNPKQNHQGGWIRLKNPNLRQFANEMEKLDEQIQRQSEQLKKKRQDNKEKPLQQMQEKSESETEKQSSSHHQHPQEQKSSHIDHSHQNQIHQNNAQQKKLAKLPSKPTQILCSLSIPCANNKVCVQGSCQSCQSDLQCPDCGTGYLSFCAKGSCRCVLNCSQFCIQKCNTGVSNTQYEVPKCGNLCACESCSNNEQCKFLKSLGKCKGEAVCSNGVCDCQGNASH